MSEVPARESRRGSGSNVERAVTEEVIKRKLAAILGCGAVGVVMWPAGQSPQSKIWCSRCASLRWKIVEAPLAA